MKLYTLEIPGDATGRLNAYIRRMLPELPEYVIREAFKKRDVKVNDVRVDKDATVTPNTTVKLYIREIEPKNPIKLLYQDDRVLVIVKPVGVSCEPDRKGGKTVTELTKELLGLQAEPLLCHRLDNPTDGLMLLCLDEGTQSELERAFQERQVHKTYTCIVKGEPKPAHQLLKTYLIKDADRARVTIRDRATAGALTILTEYTVIKKGECSRLEVALHTGRTHQIRAQLAHIGHPLLGDDLYGDRAFNKQHKAKRLMLTATALRFELTGALAYLNDKQFTYRPQF